MRLGVYSEWRLAEDTLAHSARLDINERDESLFFQHYFHMDTADSSFQINFTFIYAKNRSGVLEKEKDASWEISECEASGAWIIRVSTRCIEVEREGLSETRDDKFGNAGDNRVIRDSSTRGRARKGPLFPLLLTSFSLSFPFFLPCLFVFSFFSRFLHPLFR